MNKIKIENDYAVIEIESPKHGHFETLIDIEDIEICSKYTWRISKYLSRSRKIIDTENSVWWYVSTSIYNDEDKKSKSLLLHRLITNASPDKVVDHKNHNTLDNRKQNLRVCATSENCRNGSKQNNNKSGYKGVSWVKSRNLWMAYIRMNYKNKTLGYFKNLKDAVECRRKAELELFGEYANPDSIT